MTDTDFQSKKLYEQVCMIEDNKVVTSRVIAASYVYPGSISRLTARCRTTVVWEQKAGGIEVIGGTIEKWSDQGWMIIDEFFDTRLVFYTAEEALDYFLQIYKSFSLGLPISNTNTPVDSEPKPSAPNKADKAPNLRVLSFKDKFSKEGTKTETKKSDDSDSPDFDWI